MYQNYKNIQKILNKLREEIYNYAKDIYRVIAVKFELQKSEVDSFVQDSLSDLVFKKLKYIVDLFKDRELEEHQFRMYLDASALDKMKQLYRKKQKSKEKFFTNIQNYPITVYELDTSEENIEDLYSYFHVLNERERKILELRLQGKSYKKIQESYHEFHIKHDNLRQIVCRAKRKLIEEKMSEREKE